MSGPWPSVRLGEVLTSASREDDVDPIGEYRLLGVRLEGRGPFLRETLLGSETSASKLFRVAAGDFIYSRLFAWRGAFGVIPSELDGCHVSGEFPTFVAVQERLDPHFLRYWFTLPRTLDKVAEDCSGSTPLTRNRFKERYFLALAIPLPPLAEQRRIVARIEELAAKVAEARALKGNTKSETNGFWKVLSRIARATAHPIRSLDEMVEFLDGRRVPLSDFERQSRQGRYPYYGASGVIDHIDDYIFDEPLLLLSEDGANLINRSTPIAFIATGKYWVNNHAHVLKPKAQIVDMHFLAYALSDYDVSVFNFASAQAKLNQKNARQIRFPLPPLPEQRRIVAYLDGLQAKVDALKRLQAETGAELDALLPAILDRAFKGEL